MVNIDMRDPHLLENFVAVRELQKLGVSDEEIQVMYDRQLEVDGKEGKDD